MMVPSEIIKFACDIFFVPEISPVYLSMKFESAQVEVTRSETAGSGRFLATGIRHGNRRRYSDRFRPLPTEITGT